MPSESFEHSQISDATMTSGVMSCERSGTIAAEPTACQRHRRAPIH